MIASLLNLMRVRSTAFIAKNLQAPWCVEVGDREQLVRFHLVVQGHNWLRMAEDDPAIRLDTGDMAIIPFGKSHVYCDTPDRAVMEHGNYPGEGSLARFERFKKGANTTHMLCGFFSLSEGTPPSILARLPAVIIQRVTAAEKEGALNGVMELVESELAKEDPSPVILNRLTELICIYAIEEWILSEMDSEADLRALVDPKITPVLDAIHAEPTANWNVERLARIYGQSRTAFVERFKSATGMPPMSYVRRWRISRARHMLEANSLPLDEIAFKSGYADTNAFNRAFKRETGETPGSVKRGT